MKILSANIYGFGKWQDQQIDFRDKGLVIVSGENESGKSTLRQFILFILFGFPPKKRESYLPKTGGKMGGRLKVSTREQGIFTIERIHDRNNGAAVCFLTNGVTEDEKWLKESIGGIDYRTFQSIFSFNSSDLNQLHTIKADQLGEVLLGIGMTGSDQIYQTEKKLDSHLNQMFKPQGKKPEVNEQLINLEEIKKRLNDLKTEENSYHEKKNLETKVIEEIDELQQELTIWKKKQLYIEKQIQVSPLLNEFHETHQQLCLYKKDGEFPENGIDRYNYLKEQLMPLKSEFSVLKDNEQNYLTELERIKQLLWDPEILEEAYILSEKSGEYSQSLNEIEYLFTEISKIKKELTNDIDQLQIGLRMEDVKDLSLPFHVEETWNQLKNEKQRLSMDQENVDSETKSIEHQMKNVEESNQRINSELLPLETINDYKQKLNSHENQTKLQLFNDYNHNQKNKWQKESGQRIKQSNIVVIVCLLLSLIGVGTFLVTEINSLLILSIVLILFGIIQRLFVKNSNQRMERILNQAQTVSNSELKLEDEQFKEINTILSEQEKYLTELEKGEDDYQKLRIEQLKIEEKRIFFKTKQENLAVQIDEQIKLYPFLESVDSDYWPKLYHILITVIQRWSKITNLESAIEENKKQLTGYENEITVFFQNNDFESPQKETSEKFTFLRQLIDQQMKYKSNLEQYQEWQKQVHDLQRKITQRMKPYHEEIESLWKHASVEDEENFIKKGNNKNNQQKLENRIADIKSQLSQVLSQSELENASVKQPNEQELKLEAGIITDYLEEIELNLEGKRQALADVKALLVKMEGREDYSIVKHKFHLEQDFLKKQAKKWAVYQLAKQMLGETKQTFQKNYLPKVIKSTAYYFKQLTNNKYTNVFAPSEGDPIQVENHFGIRFNVNELSQGTSDQLYMCLRIALSEVVNEDYQLPFFIDDAFVHFDENRTKIMVKLLKKIGNEQQVILFTCRNSNEFSEEEIMDLQLV
ncbi:ATP-binding protein [Aquibacillus saliphilus]|uniref:ATP-binding protein n=1 Tax=Aquibacillus saliphilus TaxID=1909422 RepID=UPI001CF0623D|nr:AAA family ATPase [Aquibacillus saliphilus]